MATYSSRLRLTLPATGEYTNTWGTVVNDGITALVDDSISGTSAITIAGTDYTLTSVNGSTDEARRMFIVATGAPGAARNVICPAVTKLYSITNNTTGGFALTLKTSAGTGISVPNGATMLLKCDGTNVVQAASTFADITYTTTLTGGTGIVNLGSGQFYKDASGNIGVGVTPTSYGAGYTTLAANGSTAGVLDLMSGGVSQFRLFSASASENRFQGVTNVPMTFYTNNTEKMRITSGGTVVAGHTAAAGFESLCASNANAATAPMSSWNRTTAGDSFFVGWYTETTATLRGSIDYNRAGGLVRYNTTSDYRAKDIIGPVQNPGAAIDSLKVYEGVMKGATQSRPMLIAHEAQAVAPYAVTGTKDAVDADGKPVYQQIDTSSLVPLLLAELKSLRARVAALEAA